MVLEKTLESPLDSKEIKPVNPKGNQPWIFIGRTDAEVLILWPPDVKSRLTGKDPDAGKDWSRRWRGQQRMWLDVITNSMDMRLSKLWEMVKDREAWYATIHGLTKSRTWLGNWKTTIHKTELLEIWKYGSKREKLRRAGRYYLPPAPPKLYGSAMNKINLLILISPDIMIQIFQENQGNKVCEGCVCVCFSGMIRELNSHLP